MGILAAIFIGLIIWGFWSGGTRTTQQELDDYCREMEQWRELYRDGSEKEWRSS